MGNKEGTLKKSDVEGHLEKDPVPEDFKIFADRARLGLAIVDGARVIYANPKALDYTGYTQEELQKMDFWNLASEEYMQEAYDAASNVMEDPTFERPMDIPIIRKNGEIRHLRIDGGPINWKGKDLIIVSAEDVTDRKEVLDRLRASEQKYMAVLEYSPNNIYLVDAGSMCIIESNSTLQKLLGYSEEELRGMKPYDFIAHNVDDVNAKIEKLSDGEYSLVGARKYLTKMGDIIDVEVSANKIEYMGKEVISVVSWDVTELKRAHEDILDLNEVLRLISRITRHDIRNRLAIAYGITNLLKEGYTMDKNLIVEAYISIRKAIDIIKRMNELESVLLSGTSGKDVDLRNLMEEVITDYPVTYDIKGDGRVIVDDTFRSVIENIVGNAIFHGEADRIDVTIKEADGNYLITIADNGKGVPEEIRDRIFEESVSYGSNRGTGLGLFIVKKVVERSNGEVWLDETVKNGAAFIIKMPAVEKKTLKMVPTS